MESPYERCSHGEMPHVHCVFCEIGELRSRLQALEQNTVPSREAKQKLREWFSVILSDGTVIGYLTLREALDQLIEDELPHTSIVRVREVPDE